jgi:hypothetical protein
MFFLADSESLVFVQIETLEEPISVLAQEITLNSQHLHVRRARRLHLPDRAIT